MGIDINKVFQESRNKETLKARLLLFFKDAETELALYKERNNALQTALGLKQELIEELNEKYKIINTRLLYETRELNLRRIMEDFELPYKMRTEKGTRREAWGLVVNECQKWKTFLHHGFREKEDVIELAISLFKRFNKNIQEVPTIENLQIISSGLSDKELKFISVLMKFRNINLRIFDSTN